MKPAKGVKGGCVWVEGKGEEERRAGEGVGAAVNLIDPPTMPRRRRVLPIHARKYI